MGNLRKDMGVFKEKNRNIYSHQFSSKLEKTTRKVKLENR